MCKLATRVSSAHLGHRVNRVGVVKSSSELTPSTAARDLAKRTVLLGSSASQEVANLSTLRPKRSRTRLAVPPKSVASLATFAGRTSASLSISPPTSHSVVATESHATAAKCVYLDVVSAT